jgi:hypothetical protein
MLRRSIVVFAAVSTIMACTSSGNKEVTRPGPGQARITLTCNSDGTLTFSIDPWAVTLPNKDAAFTFINDQASNADGVIKANDPKYPFNGSSYNAHHASSVVAKPVAGTLANTYKYSITVDCPLPGGGSHTTIIDPDMIIPWNIL